MKYDFTCPMCDEQLIVKDWRTRPVTHERMPWCFCPRCRYKCYAEQIEEVSAQKVYIVMICDIESIPVRQQLDTLWYSWEDAAERVRYVNGLYEKNGDGLHGYYFEGVVQ